MISYHVISTGSKGNAVIIEQNILIDCGVPFKAIKPFVKDIKLVLLTHIHGDHFNKATIKRMAAERPTVRFGCGWWLVEPLVSAGVEKKNIDVLDEGTMYGYGICNVIPFRLVHNVHNCGYKLHFPHGKVFYATDTNSLDGVSAPNYDLYLVEANYEDEEIRERIAEKKLNGEYIYEYAAMQNHLSKAKCNDFLAKNMGPNSVFVYLHMHEGREANAN